MHRLAMWIHFEKCVVRRFCHCANVIECTYTNLDSIAYCYDKAIDWMIPGNNFQHGKESFLILQNVWTGSAANSASYSMCMGILSQGAEPPSSTYIKDKESYNCTSLYTFMVCTGRTVPFTFQIPSKIFYKFGYSQNSTIYRKTSLVNFFFLV
jgi:hypothetical protein